MVIVEAVTVELTTLPTRCLQSKPQTSALNPTTPATTTSTPEQQGCTLEIDTSDILVDFTGIFQSMSSGIFQRIVTCSVAHGFWGEGRSWLAALPESPPLVRLAVLHEGAAASIGKSKGGFGKRITS